jgi:hypothetical protein
MRLNEFTKAIAGALTAGGAAFATAAIDGDVTGTEWATVAVATLGALGIVWAMTAPVLKAITGALVTAVTAWSEAYSDKIVTPVEWVGIALGLSAALLLIGSAENATQTLGRHEA